MSRRAACCVAALALLFPADARPGEDEFLRAARTVRASDLEAGLPQIRVGEWLLGLLRPGSRLQWEVNDCGEQDGRPDPSRDLPVCVALETALPGDGVAFIHLSVGSERRGVVGRPALRLAGVVRGGQARLFDTLAELGASLPPRGGVAD